MLSKLKKSLSSRYQRSMDATAERMDVITRQELVEVLEDTPDELEELQRLQQELQHAQDKLEQLKEKERFVDTRLASYTKQLVNIPDDHPKKVDYQLSLNQIKAIQKQMLVELEQQKRTIKAMQERHDELEFELKECQTFLESAERATNYHQNSNDASNSINAEYLETTATAQNIGGEDDDDDNDEEHVPLTTTTALNEESSNQSNQVEDEEAPARPYQEVVMEGVSSLEIEGRQEETSSSQEDNEEKVEGKISW